jgi:CRP-like cAMP-binding protein
MLKNNQRQASASDGNKIRNELLLNLSRQECEFLFSKLEFVRLRTQQILAEGGEALKSAYFCNSGMFSILNVMPNGKSVEVGLIGKEGFLGVPLIAGFHTSHTRTMVQGEATAFRVDATALRVALKECPTLNHQLQRYSQILGAQVTQIAACNRLHELEERLARWLLMAQDRIGSETLPLTQESLAQILGSRRSSVSISASTFQKAGLIAYRHGHVTILNRRRLEEVGCDCYAALQRHIKEWQRQDE